MRYKYLNRDNKFFIPEIICACDYYGVNGAREIAHGIKEDNNDATQKAAEILTKYIPDDAILVPIPNHLGIPDTTFANYLSLTHQLDCDSKKGLLVAPIIKGKKRESLYELKRKGINPTTIDLGYYLDDLHRYIGLDLNKCYLVDNVYDTGYTYECAKEVSGIKNLIVFASSNPHIQKLCSEI